jgi:two-component system phosphate regulon response regulator OmpR
MNPLLPPDVLRILVIEDDVELAAMLAERLGRDAMVVKCCASARHGLAELPAFAPDVLVLDLMLPDSNGLDLCRQLRAAGNTTPILILTARGDPMERVLGLEMGADDYLSKPFEPRELSARLRALSRRSKQGRHDLQISFEGMLLDLLTRRAHTSAGVLALTSTEFKLLVALAEHAGRPVSREDLSSAIQPGNYLPQLRAIDVQIARLRKKLPPAPHGGEWVETVRGEGYVFTGKRQ